MKKFVRDLVNKITPSSLFFLLFFLLYFYLIFGKNAFGDLVTERYWLIAGLPLSAGVITGLSSWIEGTFTRVKNPRTGTWIIKPDGAIPSSILIFLLWYFLIAFLWHEEPTSPREWLMLFILPVVVIEFLVACIAYRLPSFWGTFIASFF